MIPIGSRDFLVIASFSFVILSGLVGCASGPDIKELEQLGYSSGEIETIKLVSFPEDKPRREEIAIIKGSNWCSLVLSEDDRGMFSGTHLLSKPVLLIRPGDHTLIVWITYMDLVTKVVNPSGQVGRTKLTIRLRAEPNKAYIVQCTYERPTAQVWIVDLDTRERVSEITAVP